MNSTGWRKVCPTCASSNDPGNLMCDRCLGDISGVAPVTVGAGAPAGDGSGAQAGVPPLHPVRRFALDQRDYRADSRHEVPLDRADGPEPPSRAPSFSANAEKEGEGDRGPGVGDPRRGSGGGAPAHSPADAPPDAGATRAEASPRLVLVLADGRELPVAAGGILGREAAGAELFAGIDQVSRRHLRIGYAEGRFIAEDLGSTNGSWVNGARIAPGAAVPLETGAELRLSSRVVCRVRVEG